MAGYLRKYIGTYRVVADYNLDTNDYPRNKDGKIDESFDDLYIDCNRGNRIYAYGHGILVAYVPVIGRGHNIIKKLYEKKIGSCVNMPYQSITKALVENSIIFGLEETDEEVLFKFKAENIELIAELLKAKTCGVNTQPFSNRNLPKAHYTIPADDLSVYKELTSKVPKEDLLILSRITKSFLDEIAAKKLRNIDSVKSDMLLKGLKGKEYIHSVGLWNEYMNYLKKKLD